MKLKNLSPSCVSGSVRIASVVGCYDVVVPFSAHSIKVMSFLMYSIILSLFACLSWNTDVCPFCIPEARSCPAWHCELCVCVGACSNNELSVSVHQMDIVLSITSAYLHVIERERICYNRKWGENTEVIPQQESFCLYFCIREVTSEYDKAAVWPLE